MTDELIAGQPGMARDWLEKASSSLRCLAGGWCGIAVQPRMQCCTCTCYHLQGLMPQPVPLRPLAWSPKSDANADAGL